MTLQATLTLLAVINVAAAEPTPATERPVQDFSEAEPQCREWADGCIVCRKSADGDTACSTPGAACVPKRPACAERSP